MNAKSGLSFFIDNNEIGDIEEELLSFKIHLENEEEKEAYHSICEIERLINEMVESQKIHTETVF